MNLRIPSRIAVDMPWNNSSHMGTGVYSETMVRALAIAAPNSEILLIVPGDSDQTIDLPNVSYHVPKHTSSVPDWFRQIAIPSMLETLRADCLFAPATLVPSIKMCPTVATVHDLTFIEHPEYYGKGLVEMLQRAFRPALSSADWLIAISEETCNGIQRHFKVDNRRIRTVEQPVRDTFKLLLSPDNTQHILKTLGIKKPFFFHVSNLAPHKNIIFALDAFAEYLKAESSNHNLVIAGGGIAPNRPPDFLARASALGISARVQYVGRLSDEYLKALYQECDIMLFPSLAEGWGLPVAEANSLGASVLASPLVPSASVGQRVPLLMQDWVAALQGKPARLNASRNRHGERAGEQLLEVLTEAVNSKPAIIHSRTYEERKEAPPMRQGEGFSIIIPSFNDLPYLKLLLKSLWGNSAYHHEIVIVTDGSADGSREYLNSLSSSIVYRHNAANLGICRTTNLAVSLSTKEWLFLINSDMVVAPGWDIALMELRKSNRVISATCIEPGVVPVAPIFLKADCGQDVESFNNNKFLSEASKSRKADTSPGFNYPFCLEKSTWDAVGGLDTAFEPGPVSDPDLYYKLCFKNAEFIRTKACVLYHFSGITLRRRTPTKWINAEEKNMQVFFEKWGEFPQYTFGGAAAPGPTAVRHHNAKAIMHLQRLCNIAVSIMLENVLDDLSISLSAAAIESFKGYAQQIVILLEKKPPSDLMSRLLKASMPLIPVILVVKDIFNVQERRVELLSHLESDITHLHEVNFLEVYFPSALNTIRRRLLESGALPEVTILNFMIDPKHIASATKTVPIYDVREKTNGYTSARAAQQLFVAGDIESARNEVSAISLRLCRPQWQCKLDDLVKLSASGAIICPGTVVEPPDQYFESRRSTLLPYMGPYPISLKTTFDEWQSSDIPWEAWILEKSNNALWNKWKELFLDSGDWNRASETLVKVASENISQNIASSITWVFDRARHQTSDINEHIEILYRYACLCNSVTEFGTRTGVSTTAFIHAAPEVLTCYDIVRHPEVNELEQHAKRALIKFRFYIADVRGVEIEQTDLLFIDTLHIYEQTLDELMRHGKKVDKYLIFHDTETFGMRGELPGTMGIWPAISRFCRICPQWRLLEHFKNNNGLTILMRG